jgi:hypothetical protein
MNAVEIGVVLALSPNLRPGFTGLINSLRRIWITSIRPDYP